MHEAVTIKDFSKIENALSGAKFRSCFGSKTVQFDMVSVIHNATIGFTDGMVVPFALNAGLAFSGDRYLLLTAGSAELVAGTISMFCGGALGAWSEG